MAPIRCYGFMALCLALQACRATPDDRTAQEIGGPESVVPQPWEVYQPAPDPYLGYPDVLEKGLRDADVDYLMDRWPAGDPPVGQGLFEYVMVRLEPDFPVATHEVAVDMSVSVGEAGGASRRLWIRRTRRYRPEPWRGPFVLMPQGEAMVVGR